MIRPLGRCLQVFLLGLIFSVYPALADGIITLKPTAEVNSPSVLLSDVFSGVPKDIDGSVAMAPAPGKSVTYDARVLAGLAARYRLDWKPQSLADSAVLTRASTRITQDMIEAAVIAKLAALNVKGKMDVLFDNRALEVALPADRMPEFTLNNFDYDAMSKRFRAELMAQTGAAPVAMPVTGRISIKHEMPVLSHRLETGAVIGKADIDWLAVPEERINGDAIASAEQLIGREVRHAIAEGQILYGRDVVLPRLVTRGALVIMKIQTPHMLITAQGRAMQDGAEGDVVRVTNTQSNRVVEGTVNGPGVVRIQTAQKMALAQ